MTLADVVVALVPGGACCRLEDAGLRPGGAQSDWLPDAHGHRDGTLRRQIAQLAGHALKGHAA